MGRTAATVDPPGQHPPLDVAFYMPLVADLFLVGVSRRAGGAERQVLMLAERLAQRGWRVGIITNPAPDGLPPETAGGARLLSHRRPRGAGRLAGKLLRGVELARMLCSVDAGVLVQRSAGTATGYVAAAAWLRRRRFVYSSANVVDFSYGRLRPGVRALVTFRLGVRLAETIVVQTPEQVALCRERFGREPVLIKSLAESQPAREGEPEAFLWIGRLAHYKRPGVFLELAESLPEARFWMVAVVGEPAEREVLDDLRAASKTLANLEVFDALPREELGAMIARSVAVVNTAAYEGMPNIFLEGWARGVPALSLGHDPDGVIERERLGGFAQGSRERFVELARGMWAQRNDQAEVAARCRDYLDREHSIDSIVDRWEHVLGLNRDARLT